MTTESSGPEAGGGSAPSSINWASLIDEFGKIGQSAAKGFSDRASDAAQKARDGSYGADQWFDDLEAFWQDLAHYAVCGIETLRRLPRA